jgi:proteasome assembly chaperone (PAC2) family protein
MKRVAFGNSLKRQEASLYNPVFLEGLPGIG